MIDWAQGSVQSSQVYMDSDTDIPECNQLDACCYIVDFSKILLINNRALIQHMDALLLVQEIPLWR